MTIEKYSHQRKFNLEQDVFVNFIILIFYKPNANYAIHHVKNAQARLKMNAFLAIKILP